MRLSGPSPETEAEMSFADILIESEYVEKEDLDYAKRIQSRLEEHLGLGEVLVKLKMISRVQLKELLRIYKKKMRLGELLVENGKLTDNQLDAALAKQKESKGKRIGTILVKMGFISERDLLEAIGEQKGLPVVDPYADMLDAALMSRMSPNYLTNNRVVPLSINENYVQVIINDLPGEEIIGELMRTFGRPVQFVLATNDRIDDLLASIGDSKARPTAATAPSVREQKTVELVDKIIAEGVGLGASDIHIEPLSNRFRLRYRIDGNLIHQTDYPKEAEKMVVARLKILGNLDIAELRRHQDGRFQVSVEGQEIDLRVSTYVTVHGENMVLRILNKQIALLSMEELGMPARQLDSYRDHVLEAPAGVVIITGPTGSGKTTTLYSSIDYCNDTSVKIITAEDPVEYQIDGIMQCSINPKIGLTFDDTLKAIVRQDPDIIVLGEIRDGQSAETCIQAALTGHKVFTTFHTEDTVGAILRLLNMEIEPFLIASTVISILGQRLVRKICDNCKEETTLSLKELRLLRINPAEMQHRKVFRGTGCDQCHHTGYQGRAAIYELMVMEDTVRDAILQRQPSYQIRELCLQNARLVTLLESGIARVMEGTTTFEEVLAKAPVTVKPRSLERIIQMVGQDG